MHTSRFPYTVVRVLSFLFFSFLFLLYLTFLTLFIVLRTVLVSFFLHNLDYQQRTIVRIPPIVIHYFYTALCSTSKDQIYEIIDKRKTKQKKINKWNWPRCFLTDSQTHRTQNQYLQLWLLAESVFISCCLLFILHLAETLVALQQCFSAKSFPNCSYYSFPIVIEVLLLVVCLSSFYLSLSIYRNIPI